MACAVGGCAGCTVLVQTAEGPAMKRVCVDGPVFDAYTGLRCSLTQLKTGADAEHSTRRQRHASAEVDLGFEVGARIRVGERFFQLDAVLLVEVVQRDVEALDVRARRSERSLP